MGEANPGQAGEELNEHQLFFARAQEWQQLLDSLDVDDVEETATWIEQALEELDMICPYRDTYIHIGGRGLIPVVDEETGGYVEDVEYCEGVNGLSAGINIFLHQGAEDIAPRFKIMHMVLVGQAKGLMDSQTHYQESKYFAYFNIEPATSITSINEIESIFEPFYFEADELPSADATVQKLGEYSEKVRHLVNSTEFRRLKQRQQARVLASLVSDAERATNVREMGLIATTQYGFVTQAGLGRLYLIPCDLKDVTIEGDLLGLESLESLRLNSGKTIRRDADLLAKNAGLCFVLSPYHSLRTKLDLTPKQVLYLPISSQPYDLQFIEPGRE